ncbi:hypothetical protein QR680_016445 [Steinernema hermaphroditum]|uniref:Uncharacterized protein n=1 Tax=Steinernema hermaphroditum TaxID=289476 RepID=A0AA39HB88_9BILA|nr:hypothetical protein QR680_016445 [Steinernema hermaphroditum]
MLSPDVYNTVLDASALIHIPFGLVTSFLVYRFSPSTMESLPYFMLHVMLWNFLGNVFGIFLHLHPLFPILCFQSNSFFGLFLHSETSGYILYGAIAVCAVNCASATVYAFPYRYFILVHPHRVERMKRKWCVMFCVFLNLCGSVAILFFYIYLALPYDEYPFDGERPSYYVVICFHPTGTIKAANGICVAAYFVLLVLIRIVFSLLLRRHMAESAHMYNAQTLQLHRKYMRYLAIVTVVPMVFGGIPLIITVLCIHFPTIPYSREAFMICMMVIYNHGTLLSIVTVVTFKPYREALRKMVRSFWTKAVCTNTTIYV